MFETNMNTITSVPSASTKLSDPFPALVPVAPVAQGTV